MILALVGNQNCGKTTLFNQLTGANQHVGNFPGVTVDRKTGSVRSLRDCSVVDLPGIYSIRPYSGEEIVTRDFILNEKPNGIINIVDATNIERNLYLTLQLLELKIPMVIALNMMDEVRGNGGTVNIAALSDELGVPVVPISASKNEGVDDLIETVYRTTRENRRPARVDFCAEGPVHRCIHAVSHMIEDHAAAVGISSRFAATKLIEGDSDITKRLALNQNELDMIEHSVVEMESEYGMDRQAALADMRYSFIENVAAKTVVRAKESREHKRSVKIDNVLTNKYLAMPLFVLIMCSIFFLTFNVIGAFFQNLLERGIDALALAVGNGLTSFGTNPIVRSLVVDGIFGGVGSVVSFVPIIVILFFFLSILEDTGYMARVAFVMDKLLRKIGLSGKSFVPMLIGFGCTVPAVMATRTLSSERDRRMTVLLTPYMSCSAKIPIYAFFSAAFFPKTGALVMIALYFGGIVVGILMALLLNHTAFRGKPIPFVMELPNYRFPSPKSVLQLMWDKAKDFLTKAFTVIFLATVIIWFLRTFDIRLNPVGTPADSLLALIGGFLSPALAPIGLGGKNGWIYATALISGFTAKEAVVSTLSTLTADVTAVFPNIAVVASFLAFTLLYPPCIAAIAAAKRELGSRRSAAVMVLMQCAVAYVVSFFVYRFFLLFV